MGDGDGRKKFSFQFSKTSPSLFVHIRIIYNVKYSQILKKFSENTMGKHLKSPYTNISIKFCTGRFHFFSLLCVCGGSAE